MDADIRRDFKALLLAQPFWDETRERRAFLRDLFADHPLYKIRFGSSHPFAGHRPAAAKNQRGQRFRETSDQRFSDQKRMGAEQTTRKPM